jgi:hypothetical protein
MIELIRFAYTPFGTFGALKVFNFQCFTVEQEWNNNKKFVSCIPEGEWQFKRDFYNRGNYETFEISVPNRSEIKIHKANLASELSGCIALGTDLGFYKNQWAILNSSAAFNNFMNVMKDVKNGTITIKNSTDINNYKLFGD